MSTSSLGAPTGRSRFVPLHTGLTYHVLEWGSPDLPPLVMCHGFLDFAWTWELVARAGLAERFHIIAPDFRGHGESDRVGAGGYYHFLDYMADLTSLVDCLELERFALVGHSMGGSVATNFTGTFPKRVTRLALLEGLGPPEGDLSVVERIPTWLAGWKKALGRTSRVYPSVEAAARRLQKTDALVTEEIAVWLAERATEPVPGGFQFRHDPLHLTQAPLPFRVAHAELFWSRIECPVLLVDGSESLFRHAGEEVQKRKSRLSNVTEVTLDHAAHMMMRHQPAALARALEEFFAP